MLRVKILCGTKQEWINPACLFCSAALLVKHLHSTNYLSIVPDGPVSDVSASSFVHAIYRPYIFSQSIVHSWSRALPTDAYVKKWYLSKTSRTNSSMFCEKLRQNHFTTGDCFHQFPAEQTQTQTWGKRNKTTRKKPQKTKQSNGGKKR